MTKEMSDLLGTGRECREKEKKVTDKGEKGGKKNENKRRRVRVFPSYKF